MFISTLVSATCVFALGTFFYIDENKCPENAPRLDCDEGFSTELVNSLKWMPVVSIIPCFIETSSSTIGILQVSIILFIFFLNIGIGPIPWMINGELFPEECKSASASLSTIVNWLMAFTVTKTVVNLQAVLGYSGTYFLYGSLTTLGAIYILLGVPETKGKSPDEILQYFKIGLKKTVLLEEQESKSRGDTSPDTTSSSRKQLQISSTSMDTKVGLHV